MKTAELARGRWIGILKHFGVDEAYLRNVHGPCPVCQGKDRYRFDDKEGNGTSYCSKCGSRDGMGLLMELKGWTFHEAAKEVDLVIGNIPKQERPKRNPDYAINRVSEVIKPAGAAVKLYLANRGLRCCSGLYQARQPYFDNGAKFGDFDCMVGPIRDANGNLESYHLTYLSNGYKAVVGAARKILTPRNSVKGCAIRLTDIYPHMGVAEGVETALAVMDLFNLPCWAVLNAGNMEHFDPPKGIERVTVFADNDKSYTGQAAAFALAKRLQLRGIVCDVEIPEQPGTDFADIKIKRRTAA